MDRLHAPPRSPDMGPGVRLQPGVRQGLHRHADARIVLFFGGEMRESGIEGQGRFTRGEFVFRPAHFAHEDLAGREGAAYVRFRPSHDLVRKWVARNGWRAARGRVRLDRALRVEDLLEAAVFPAYELRAPRTPAQKVARLLSAESAPTLQDIAHQLGLAPYDLTRRFLAEFKVTPRAYRRHARLQRAMQMLCEGGSSLARIAHAAGYCDQSHLTHELRREIGLTPGAWRNLFG